MLSETLRITVRFGDAPPPALPLNCLLPPLPPPAPEPLPRPARQLAHAPPKPPPAAASARGSAKHARPSRPCRSSPVSTFAGIFRAAAVPSPRPAARHG